MISLIAYLDSLIRRFSQRKVSGLGKRGALITLKTNDGGSPGVGFATFEISNSAVREMGAGVVCDHTDVRISCVRSNAAAELPARVEAASGAGDKVLIVPLLLSYGGIEQGIKKRLEGLDYTIADLSLLPDERLGLWVKNSVLKTR